MVIVVQRAQKALNEHFLVDTVGLCMDTRIPRTSTVTYFAWEQIPFYALHLLREHHLGFIVTVSFIKVACAKWSILSTENGVTDENNNKLLSREFIVMLQKATKHWVESDAKDLITTLITSHEAMRDRAEWAETMASLYKSKRRKRRWFLSFKLRFLGRPTL